MKMMLPKHSSPLCAVIATICCSLSFVADLLCGAIFQIPHGIDVLMFPLRPTLLTREMVHTSLDAGTSFLLAMQKPAGDFIYEVDWSRGVLTQEDNQVRQAGALWGLALVYRRTGREDVLHALHRGIEFHRQAYLPREGPQLIHYSGGRVLRTGTISLVLLAHLDVLDGKAVLPEAIRSRLFIDAEFLLDLLLTLRRSDGHFYESLDYMSHEAYGSPSPYYDGESLLALARALRILDRDDLKSLIVASASKMRDHWVIESRRECSDSSQTKGFFQWGIMAFHEISGFNWPEAAWCPDSILDLADWMIDIHHTLWRTKNTAYALEGMLHALDIARQQGDHYREKKYRHVCRVTLEKLTSWQVGGPLPNLYIRSRAVQNPEYIGGIQNSSFDPRLRIDVTQHQLHAIMLALDYLYPLPSEDVA